MFIAVLNMKVGALKKSEVFSDLPVVNAGVTEVYCVHGGSACLRSQSSLSPEKGESICGTRCLVC